MSSPSGVTMPAIEILESSVYVLKKGTQVLGQVVSVQPQSQIQSRKLARIGDTNKTTSYSPAEHSFNVEVYAEKDPNEMAALLGGTQKPVSGGWVGTEQLRLNPTVAKFDMTMEVYGSATGSNDELQGTWHIKGFKPTTLNPSVQADANVTIQINGECDDIYYQPEAGIGA